MLPRSETSVGHGRRVRQHTPALTAQPEQGPPSLPAFASLPPALPLFQSPTSGTRTTPAARRSRKAKQGGAGGIISPALPFLPFLPFLRFLSSKNSYAVLQGVRSFFLENPRDDGKHAVSGQWGRRGQEFFSNDLKQSFIYQRPKIWLYPKGGLGCPRHVLNFAKRAFP